MKKICKQCLCDFKQKRKKQIFCSRKCSAIFRGKSKEYREQMSLKLKEVSKTDKNKETRKQVAIKLWNNKEYREKMRKIQSSEQYKEKISKASRNNWKNEKFKEKMSNIRKKVWTNELKISHSIKMKEKWNNIEYKEMMMKIYKERWSDPNFAHKMLTTGFRRKLFIFPSGKNVYLQGNEPQALTKLLKQYNEIDIIVGVKNINNEIGIIKYKLNNSLHTYYPDIYIKSDNKVIEVKSKYYFNLDKKKNLAKEHACLTQGFNFEFMIID